MKSQLILIVFIALVSIFSFPSNLTNAEVICVDKYNNTSVIPCSDQNAVVKNSVNTAQVGASGQVANLNSSDYYNPFKASLQEANMTAGNMTNSTTSNVTNYTGSRFITNSSPDCERGKNAGKIDAGSDLSSHLGYNKSGHNYANEGQHFLSCYSTAYDQEYARLQFGHQQNSSSSVISSSQQQNQTCDKVGYASCYSTGYSAGKSSYNNTESFGCLPPIVLNSTQNHNYCLGYHTAQSQPTQYNQGQIRGSGNLSQSNASSFTSVPTPARIQLLFYRTDHTGGYLFTTHWVVWGKVANTGGTSSTPISVQIACTNTNSGAPLYSTTTPLVPSVLGPGETGTFSQPISSDDLQGTKYSFSCTAQPVVQ